MYALNIHFGENRANSAKWKGWRRGALALGIRSNCKSLTSNTQDGLIVKSECLILVILMN